MRLTVEQWNALHGAAVGELESLTEHDEASGVFNDLRAAVAELKKARQTA